MGVNIGWIFGSVACFSTVWAYLFFPELKVRNHCPLFIILCTNILAQARSLEEVDELFEAKLPARHFGKYKTCGTGRHIASLENNGRDDKNKVGDESVEVA
jgi:SP family sugar:H+ symporter-like MFS transporter